MTIINESQTGYIASLQGYELPIRVLSKRNNLTRVTEFFIGCFHNDKGIVSKESVEVYSKQIDAEEALSKQTFTQQFPTIQKRNQRNANPYNRVARRNESEAKKELSIFGY